MQVRMKREILTPGVQHREESDFGTQMLGVCRDSLQGFGNGVEQDIVDGVCVLRGNCGNLFGHGKHDVEVLGVEKLGLSILNPLGSGQRLALRTAAIATRVVRHPLLTAIVALLDMTTERCRSATFDGGHGGTLSVGERGPVLLPIGATVAAENVRYLRPRATHCSTTQKCLGAGNTGSGSAGCGSNSNGLVVAQTLLAAMRRYTAVVDRLR